MDLAQAIEFDWHSAYSKPSRTLIDLNLNIGFDRLPKIIEDRSQSVQAARSL